MKIALLGILAVGGVTAYLLFRKRKPANLGELAATGALAAGPEAVATGGQYAKSGIKHF